MKGLSSCVVCLLFLVIQLAVHRALASPQHHLMKRCNREFKSTFERAVNRRELGPKGMYCSAMQNYINCLSDANYTGSFVDDLRYVVLQHGMMDKKSLFCPNHQYTHLRNLIKRVVKKHLFVDDIGRDHWSKCASDTHLNCVAQMTSNMETNSNMCEDMQNFINCYEKAKPTCNAKIVKHFSHMCKQLGERMLKLSKQQPGLMC